MDMGPQTTQTKSQEDNQTANIIVIFGVVIFVVILLALGYIMLSRKPAAQVAKVTPTPTLPPTHKLLPTPVVSKTTHQISAGANPKYTMQAFDDWQTTSGASPNPLILSRSDYTLTIDQSSSPVIQCSFDTPTGNSQGGTLFYAPVAITEQGKAMMLGMTSLTAENGSRQFVICEQVNGSYQSPTTYGKVTVTSPDVVAGSVMDQVRTMVASLKKL